MMSFIYEYTEKDMDLYIDDIFNKFNNKEMNNIEMLEIFEKYVKKTSKKKRGRPSKNTINDDYKIIYNSNIDTKYIDFPIQLEKDKSIFKMVIFKDTLKLLICNENGLSKEFKEIIFTNYSNIEIYCEKYIFNLLINGYYFKNI